MGYPITVLIHTLNEEKNIRNCLECVKWAEDIVIIDMYSDDRTVDIAREYTDRIYFHERMKYVEPARQFGLKQARNEWVLVVDADELVPVSLCECLLEIMRSGKYDAVSVPHRNFIFGHAMLGDGWGALQDRHIRFFRKKSMSFGAKIHGGTKLDTAARVFVIKDEECAFIHFNYISVEQFLEKLNRYTTIEAENNWDTNKPLDKFRAVRHIIRALTGRFIKKKGYKDGFQGFLLACLMVGYEASAVMKRYLMEKYESKEVSEKIIVEYNEIAKQEIERYKR